MEIFDAHMHLNYSGLGVEAARMFRKSGGTGMMLVNKPDWTWDFKRIYDTTIRLAEAVRRDTGLYVFIALGPHPAYITRDADRKSLEDRTEAIRGGIDLALRYILEGKAHVLGEVGRPHYPVDDDVWEASNSLLRYALEQARDAGCSVILHTESQEGTFEDLSRIARDVGYPLEHLVKHFSPPLVLPEETHGLFPSVLASEKNIRAALEKGTSFMMETDYIDDPARPGAVLGPRTVPRVTVKLMNEGVLEPEAAHRVHRENPERVYRIVFE